MDLEALTKPFPTSALKTRDGGGGRRFTYVETHTVIHRLNDACPDGWDWRIVKLEWHGDLLICYGELSITGLGTRAGIGVQKVSERGGEDLAKGASSDALKKAATLFGVALELYGPDYEDTEHAQEQSYKGETHYSGEPHTAENTFGATPKQNNAIHAMVPKLGWADGQARDEMARITGKRSVKDMTVAEASKFIGHLETKLAEQAARRRLALT